MPVEMRSVKKMETNREKLHEMRKDMLRAQCAKCKRGDKMGPKSGCDVRKKLIIDDSAVAWKNQYLFFDDNGNCKMYQEA